MLYLPAMALLLRFVDLLWAAKALKEVEGWDLCSQEPASNLLSATKAALILTDLQKHALIESASQLRKP